MKLGSAAWLCAAMLSTAPPGIASAATPPQVWSQQPGVSVIYNSDGTVCSFKSGGNCSSGGSAASSSVIVAVASDNHQNIKNGAGTLYGFGLSTIASAAQFVRYYDAGTGFNGCNSATGLIWSDNIPAASTAANGGGRINSVPSVGIAFTTGLSICITGAFGSTDTTNATASATTVSTAYK